MVVIYFDQVSSSLLTCLFGVVPFLSVNVRTIKFIAGFAVSCPTSRADNWIEFYRNGKNRIKIHYHWGWGKKLMIKKTYRVFSTSKKLPFGISNVGKWHHIALQLNYVVISKQPPSYIVGFPQNVKKPTKPI